ncbi:MAG: histidine kinase [Flavobacteriales bacterium]|nr:histidine kinase [Flavobacteriales bacterium]
MRCRLAFLFLLAPLLATAQFPLTRSIDVRSGQQRMPITAVVQDAHGLLWVGGEHGLFRTDGELVEPMARTGRDAVVALAHAKGRVWAAFRSGSVLRCTTLGCDTVLVDTLLRGNPVRGLALDGREQVWIATHGAGIRVLSDQGIIRVGIEEGMPDAHVNGIAALPDGRMVAATDQGLVLLNGGRVQEVLDETKGAPDNLVLAVTTDEQGNIWAGTDRGGVFRWTPGKAEAVFRPAQQVVGAIRSIAARDGMVWAGSDHQGVLMFDTRLPGSLYRATWSGRQAPITGLFVAADGAVWWCDGSERVHHADPAVLMVPEDEGKDLRRVTALCMGPGERLWFADPEGLHSHQAGFALPELVRRERVQVPPNTPVVSLAAADDGTIWAATFGSGVHAVRPDGSVLRHTTSHGLPNDNVLAVRTWNGYVWCATLDGLAVLQPGAVRWLSVPVPGPGFVYDVLPLDDGRVIAATDGSGLLAIGADGTVRLVGSDGPRTFYSLLQSGDAVWAVGPGTGLCRLKGDALTCMGGTELFGEPFGLAASHGRILVFGRSGAAAYDPVKDTWSTVSARFGLDGAQGPLNAVASPGNGDVWLATERGLLRLRPGAAQLDAPVAAAILDVALAGTRQAPDTLLRTTHDRNDVVIRFAAPVQADPGAVRFAYRLAGHDDEEHITRDRQVSYADLPPGRYTFHVRAFAGETPPPFQRTGTGAATFALVIDPPLWQRPWVIVTAVLLLGGAGFLLLRARERRAQQRTRMEQEKVRFQLEALRSQVDPHFLFNSFNTLVELIESDPDGAVAHVDQLSTFYRSILQLRDKELIPLRDELDLLRSYFILEQRRFGERIALEINVADDALDKGIVPLTLQMLVENALKHNAITGPGAFVATVRVEGDDVVVENPLKPRVTAARSTGFGLESITRRYVALTERPVQVERDGGRFVVRIPLITLRS